VWVRVVVVDGGLWDWGIDNSRAYWEGELGGGIGMGSIPVVWGDG